MSADDMIFLGGSLVFGVLFVLLVLRVFGIQGSTTRKMTTLFASKALHPQVSRAIPNIFVIPSLVGTLPTATTRPVSPYTDFIMDSGGNLSGMPPNPIQPRGDE